MFVVKDLERLKEYGFQKTGERNIKGWNTYQKILGEACCFGLVSSRLFLLVNPSFSETENELVVSCDVDYGKDTYSEVMWSFDELMQMLQDGVIEWSKLPRP